MILLYFQRVTNRMVGWFFVRFKLHVLCINLFYSKPWTQTLKKKLQVRAVKWLTLLMYRNAAISYYERLYMDRKSFLPCLVTRYEMIQFLLFSILFFGSFLQIWYGICLRSFVLMTQFLHWATWVLMQKKRNIIMDREGKESLILSLVFPLSTWPSWRQ